MAVPNGTSKIEMENRILKLSATLATGIISNVLLAQMHMTIRCNRLTNDV